MKWEKVELVEDFLSTLLGVEQVGHTCERCGRQVIVHKYAFNALFGTGVKH